MLPRSMIPYEVFGAGTMNNTAQCPGCLDTFVIGNGVAYLTYFEHNGHVHYGHVSFCCLECVLTWIPEEGFAHA